MYTNYPNKKSVLNPDETKVHSSYNFLLDKISHLENIVENLSSMIESVISSNIDKDKEIQDLKKSNSELNTELGELGAELENLSIDVVNLNQYGRRECVELTGIAESIPQKDLETHILEIFKEIEVELTHREMDGNSL